MVSVMEEKAQIHETLANYCFYVDGCEFEKWVDLFTEDCVWETADSSLVCEGKETLLAFIRKRYEGVGAWCTLHCVMNEVIAVDGDNATARSYFVVVFKEAGTLITGMGGRYEDHLVKQEGCWLFKNRKLHVPLLPDAKKDT